MPYKRYMPTNKTDPEYKYRECAWMCCTISSVDISFHTKSCYLEICQPETTNTTLSLKTLSRTTVFQLDSQIIVLNQLSSISVVWNPHKLTMFYLLIKVYFIRILFLRKMCATPHHMYQVHLPQHVPSVSTIYRPK